jgi:hypothetical protein
MGLGSSALVLGGRRPLFGLRRERIPIGREARENDDHTSAFGHFLSNTLSAVQNFAGVAPHLD